MIVDHFVHAVSCLAVRTLAPRVAKEIVSTLGARLRPLTVVEGERMACRLVGGTCLTRSIAVAARVPGARVVIGGRRGVEFSAHAWVEVGTTRLGDPGDNEKVGELF